jgi:hypothetical protein
MQKYLRNNDLRIAQATSLSADSYAPLSLSFFLFTQKIIPAVLFLYLVSVAMHYDIDAMHYDIDAMHYDIDAMHYDIDAMTREKLWEKGVEWWLNREESKVIMCYV